MDTRGVTGVLDRVVEAHEGMPPDAFNDDLLYKRNLNQARRGTPPDGSTRFRARLDAA